MPVRALHEGCDLGATQRQGLGSTLHHKALHDGGDGGRAMPAVHNQPSHRLGLALQPPDSEQFCSSSERLCQPLARLRLARKGACVHGQLGLDADEQRRSVERLKHALQRQELDRD